jgi:hypothetical protein
MTKRSKFAFIVGPKEVILNIIYLIYYGNQTLPPCLLKHKAYTCTGVRPISLTVPIEPGKNVYNVG